MTGREKKLKAIDAAVTAVRIAYLNACAFNGYWQLYADEGLEHLEAEVRRNLVRVNFGAEELTG